VVEILVIVPHCFFDLKFESQNHSNETAVEISGKAADHVRQLLTISCIGLMILINVITMYVYGRYLMRVQELRIVQFTLQFQSWVCIGYSSFSLCLWIPQEQTKETTI
ncbi:unnamed protein product, partial [Didymodactylos carnosus]